MLELGFYTFAIISVLIPIGYFVGSLMHSSFNYYEIKETSKFGKLIAKIEENIFKLCGIDYFHQMSNKEYFLSLLILNLFVGIITFILIYFQSYLSFNEPKSVLDVSLIFHIISSYLTNTDQDHSIADLQLLPITKYFTLPLLMFFSSATGICVAMMFIRSITKGKIGNFYVDFIKSIIRILLPIGLILSILYVLLGSPNTFKTTINYTSLENIKQTLLIGPIAAVDAIRILGQNGGSTYTANSAHPFSLPSYISSFLQAISMLIIPISSIFALGFFLKNQKQAIVILIALFTVLVSEFCIASILESNGNPMINSLMNNHSGNWIAKETRIGIIPSSLFSIIISNTSGATNSALESYHPIAVAMMLFNLANQGIFGGQSLGVVYSINYFIYTAIFIGLMLGKFPEIFGRKIEKPDIIFSSLIFLLNPFLVLIGVVITFILLPLTFNSYYENIHYYTQILYEFLSAAANNGSGLENLNDNMVYFNTLLGIVMLIGYFGSKCLMIYLGSSLAKKPVRISTGESFRTDTILFSMLYLFMLISLTLLTFFPFILIGAISEYFIMG